MPHHHEEHRSAHESLPSPWEFKATRRPTRATLLGALYRNRDALRAQYPHLLLPGAPRPTPVVALLDLWRDWDLASAPCGACGGLGLAGSMGGMLTIGSLGGVCIDCKRIVHRTIGGGISTIMTATAQLRERHKYHFFGSFPATWSVGGPSQGIVAVLQELGVPGLRLTRRGTL